MDDSLGASYELRKTWSAKLTTGASGWQPMMYLDIWTTYFVEALLLSHEAAGGQRSSPG